MKKYILVFLIIIFSQQLVFSQKYTQVVRGTVVDADNKSALIGATVIVVGTNPIIGVATDTKGRFRLENVPIGRISLQVSYIGFDTKTISDIDINTGKETVLDLCLQESVIKMKEVVITANKTKGEALNDMSIISSRSISLEETKRYTGGMDDPARVVSSFAGVANSPSSSDIIVRGNSPKYVQWRLEGIEITSPYHMNDQNSSFGALTALNNSLLATSDFHTGAFSSEYGDVLSSVMDIKLRTGNNEKFEAAIGIGVLGTDITIEGPFKKDYAGSYLINYRYSTVSLIQNLGLVNINGVVDYQDATFKLMLPTKKIGIFSIFGLSGLSGFNLENIKAGEFLTPGSSTSNANISKDYKKTAYLSNLGLNHVLTLTKNSFLKTSIYYSGDGIKDNIFESDSIIKNLLTVKSKIINAKYKGAVNLHYKLNAKNKIQIGTKYTMHSFNNKQSIYNTEISTLFDVVDFKKNINTINNFISWKYLLNDKISIVSGIHNANVLFNNKYSIEPRIALNWNINSKNSINVGYGKHSTMENIHNYFTKILQNDGSLVEPNKNLDLLKADHYVLSYKKRFTDKLNAKIEFYYQHLYNLPVENNDTSYYATINEGIDYRYVALVNKGTGKNYGVEFTLEKFFDKNYYFLINATLFNSKYKALEGIERNTQYNSNYLVNILWGREFKNLGKKQNKILSINSKLFLGGGKKYIPLLRDSQGNVSVETSKNMYWDYSKAYDKKFEDIYYVNLSISYKINNEKTTHEIFLDLMNLTNNQVKISEYYDNSKANKVNYIKDFGLFPNLMYRIYF